jgi:TRAP-type C4-dicarboxylate transport system permease small subunit
LIDWIYPVLATLGFGLGLRLRGQSIAAMSVVVMVAMIAVSIFSRETLLSTISTTAISLICLQVGFLIGAAIAAR